MLRYDEFNVPTCGNIAIWQLCRERQPFWNSHDGLDQSLAQALPKADAKEVLYSLPSKFDPWVYILFLDEGDLCSFAQENLPVQTGLCRHQCFSVVAQATPKIRPRPAERLNQFSRWKKVGEGCVCWDMMSSMCQHVATLQFAQLCRERQPFWNSHDGLDQSLAQAPPKADAKEVLYSLPSKFDPWVYILFLDEGDLCSFAQENLPVETGLCRTSVFLCGCASHAKDSPKASRKAKSIFPMKVGEGCVCWDMMSSMCQHVATLQFGSCAEKDSLSGTVMMVWIKASHKLLPRLTQKKCCTVYLLNLIHEFTSFFSTKVIYAALPKKTFPWKQAFVDISVSLWLRKPRHRFAQGQPKG